MLAAVTSFGLGLVLTWLGWRAESAQIEALAQREFAGLVDERVAALRDRTAAIEQLLRGGVGIAAGHREVSPIEWHNYADAMNLPERFPEVQGILWAPLAGPAASLVAPVAAIEPMNAANRRLLGTDLAATPAVRAGIDRARDGNRTAIVTSMPTATSAGREGPVTLLMLVPVPVATTAEHGPGRSRGFVAATVRLTDLMQRLVEARVPEIAIDLMDHDAMVQPLYRGHEGTVTGRRDLPARRTRDVIFPIGGRDWLLRFHSLPAFDQRVSGASASVVAAAGLLLSGLLAWLVALAVSERSRARTLAELLRRSNERQCELDVANEQLMRACNNALTETRMQAEFVANLSHEIRTPIQGLLGHTELALELPLDDEVQEFLENVRECSNTLLVIVNNVLDFGKLEAGSVELDDAPFALRELIARSLRTVVPLAREKEIELIWSVDPDVPDRLRGDRLRICEVLMNLLGNAVKFTETGEVELRVTRVTGHSAAPRMRFSVRDTGCGMSERVRQQLFLGFHQGDPSSKHHHGGAGLGLAICARLVTLMGGTIEADSTPGKGSEFAFVIALVSETVPVDEPPVPRLRALLFEDNWRQAAAIARLLAPHAIIVSRAPGSAEGAGIESGWDVMLVAQRFAGCDAFALATALRERGPVVMLLDGPGEHEASARAARLRLGTGIKPVDPPALVAQIRECLDASPDPVPRRPVSGSAVPPEPARLRILVAEDNPVNQRVIVRMLERLGHEVTLVANGAAAVDAFDGGRFEAILMDIEMPVMDGVEATAHIRERERSGTRSRVPIIALTANALPGDRARYLAAGMDEHLPKPLPMGALDELLRRILVATT